LARGTALSNISDSHSERLCPYCNGTSVLLVASSDRNRHTTQVVFDYYSCQQCGLIFMDSPPTDMSPFYAGGYEKIPENLQELRLVAEREKYRLDPVLRHKNKGRLLEIGPWRGVFSCNMKDSGFDVSALEMDASCVRFLREQVGIDAIQTAQPAETMKHLQPGFDVIAGWHSLEHLPEPWLVIQQAARLLAPGGILLLALPNPDSYEFSVLKAAWRHLDAPRHLYFFPLRTLTEICRENGMEPLEITTADKLSQILARDNWRNWARSWIPVRYVRRVMGGVAGRILYRVTYRKQMEEGRGSGYTAVFIKN
jgi:2-polyprenyl-3-methyl-5-hydroxy-6-metoxy-1,4-benzoquinol methylase